MRDQATRPCAGCGAPAAMRDPTRQSWCDDCRHLSVELLTIARVGRILREYSLAESAAAVDAALELIREQLRTGVGPARERAKVATACAMLPRGPYGRRTWPEDKMRRDWPQLRDA